MLFSQMSDSAIASIVIAGIAWLAALSYLLGRYTNKVDALIADHDEHGKTISKIFERLDKISEMRLPCDVHDQRLKELERIVRWPARKAGD